jgi:hypothetical protein
LVHGRTIFHADRGCIEPHPKPIEQLIHEAFADPILQHFRRAMKPIIIDLNTLSPRMAKFEAYSVEVFLSSSSLWAAWVLLSGETWQGGMVGAKAAFITAASLGSEMHWGSVALIAALLKIGGIAMTFTRFATLALVLRLAGIGISAVFWILLGVLAIHDDPYLLFAFPVVQLGVAAWWMLVRLSTLPRNASPSLDDRERLT